MINIMAANVQDRSDENAMRRMAMELDIQIHNAERYGWKKEDVWAFNNFGYANGRAAVYRLPIETPFVKGTKTLLMEHLLPNVPDDEICWIHDLDAWQVHEFNTPDFQDIGIVPYSPKNPAFNSGSVFYRTSAVDIVKKTADKIRKQDPEKCVREEFAINDVFFRDEFRERVTPLNFRYNLGCSNYGKRMKAAEKPVFIRHFHPERDKDFKKQTREPDFPAALKKELEILR